MQNTLAVPWPNTAEHQSAQGGKEEAQTAAFSALPEPSPSVPED